MGCNYFYPCLKPLLLAPYNSSYKGRVSVGYHHNNGSWLNTMHWNDGRTAKSRSYTDRLHVYGWQLILWLRDQETKLPFSCEVIIYRIMEKAYNMYSETEMMMLDAQQVASQHLSQWPEPVGRHINRSSRSNYSCIWDIHVSYGLCATIFHKKLALSMGIQL